mgnify:CR=1 FL=1
MIFITKNDVNYAKKKTFFDINRTISGKRNFKVLLILAAY